MYACIYVCMYVCMDRRIFLWFYQASFYFCTILDYNNHCTTIVLVCWMKRSTSDVYCCWTAILMMMCVVNIFNCWTNTSGSRLHIIIISVLCGWWFGSGADRLWFVTFRLYYRHYTASLATSSTPTLGTAFCKKSSLTNSVFGFSYQRRKQCHSFSESW